LILTRTDKQRNVQGISPTREEGPYLLVHGAWHGSWCWKRIRKRLQDVGHQVFTPTLTFHPSAGRSGPQAHLLRPLWRMEFKQAFTALRHERVEIYQRTNSLRNSIGDATDYLTRTMRLTFWPQAGTTHLFEQPTNGLKRKDGRLARLAVDMK
jgi:hypothetical protein